MKLGSLMISGIVGFCRNLGDEIGVRFISVDAYNNEKTIKFYENNFFVGLESVMKKKVEETFQCIETYVKNLIKIHNYLNYFI